MDSVYRPNDGNNGIPTSAEVNIGESMTKLAQSKKKFHADVLKAKSKNPDLPKEVTSYTEEEIVKLLEPFDSIFKTVDNRKKLEKALYEESNKNYPTSTSNAGNDLSKKEEKREKYPTAKFKKDKNLNPDLSFTKESTSKMPIHENISTPVDNNKAIKRRVTRSSVASLKALKNPVKDKKLKAPKQWLEDERELYKSGLGLTNKEFDRLRNAVKVTQSTQDSIMVKPVEKLGNWPILNPGPVPREAREKLKSLDLLEYGTLNSEDKKYFGKTANEFDRMVYGHQIRTETDIMRTNKLIQIKENLKSEDYRDPNLVAEDEFIMTLKFYHSFKSEDFCAFDNFNQVPESKYLYEIQVLGSQTLQDLRELLRCEYDYTCMKSFDCPQEYIDNPDKDQFYAMNKFKNALFCIGQKVYIEPSEERSKINAQHIIKWANDKKNRKNIGPFEIGDSSKTLIKDLKLRFGYPYAFIHFGTCEHLVVFTSCRLATIEDPIEKKCYPRIIAAGAFRENVICNVDNKITAKWIVKDCNRFPLEQMMICDDCLKTYCYNEYGKKVGKFELYPIVSPKL